MHLCSAYHSPVSPTTPTIEKLPYLPRDSLSFCTGFLLALYALLT